MTAMTVVTATVNKVVVMDWVMLAVLVVETGEAVPAVPVAVTVVLDTGAEMVVVKAVMATAVEATVMVVVAKAAVATVVDVDRASHQDWPSLFR